VLLSIARLPGASTPEVVSKVETVARELAVSLPSGSSSHLSTTKPRWWTSPSARSVMPSDWHRPLRGGHSALPAQPARGFCGIAVGPAPLGDLPTMGSGPEPESHVARRPAVAIGLVIDDAIVVIEAIGKRVQEVWPPRMLLGRRRAPCWQPRRDHRDHGGGVPPARLVAGRGRPILLGFGDDAFDGGSHLLGVALTTVPLAARQWLRRARKPRGRHATQKPTLTWCARCSSGLGSACSWRCAPRPGRGQRLRVPSGFLPTMDEGAFVLDYFLPAGTSSVTRTGCTEDRGDPVLDPGSADVLSQDGG